MSSPTDAWQVEPKPVPDALTDTFTRADYEPEPDEWLEIRKRLSEKDRAALSKVFGIYATAVDDNRV